MKRLNEKIAIVTGAGRGIGKETALCLAEEGAHVVVAGRHLDSLIITAEKIQKLGRQCKPMEIDISLREKAQKLIDFTLREFGRIDILVNNAGINRDAMLHKMTIEEWDEVIAINLTGTFNVLQLGAIVMRKQEYGRIINISSASWLGNIGQANYSASKAGIIGLTKTAARELAKKGVTVNAICPGFIETDMTKSIPKKVWDLMVAKIPMGYVGTPRDIANAVLFLASEEASYITGEVLNVGGGLVL
ncbi:MAG TPA: 3-oxoacyl-ACP reductase FabG [Firmicutes bacterium]|jgi:3-oxoacyl-[acyl-carrier protein] reductase/2-hydroxycyclohexanecarboxyl-CoA dehydrogenase|nr:3-oxoacyl-ACP reductase FabG [Bacillota bacterium]